MFVGTQHQGMNGSMLRDLQRLTVRRETDAEIERMVRVEKQEGMDS
jgi:hypothetical protein